MLLRKPRTIITGIITTGIMGVAAPTGTTIALTGRGEVPARRQLVEPLTSQLRKDSHSARSTISPQYGKRNGHLCSTIMRSRSLICRPAASDRLHKCIFCPKRSPLEGFMCKAALASGHSFYLDELTEMAEIKR